MAAVKDKCALVTGAGSAAGIGFAAARILAGQGMRLALQRSPLIAPWLWGLNGATSVCASVLAIVIAIGAGISAAFWVGALCYAVAWEVSGGSGGTGSQKRVSE